METPLVTIFTITRNRCDLLPRAMKSVLNQTYNNIEYIIIDSASTDNTESVVNSFDDKRVRYIKLSENKTFGQCFNMAVDIAEGKYVTELDDDDEYHLDKIEKQVSLFESLSEEYGMVYCWMTYYDNQSKKQIRVHKAELRGNVLDDVVEKPTVSGTPTLLFRRDIFDKIGGYKETDEIGVESDWEFACRICKYYKVDYVPESLVNVYIYHNHLRMSNRGYYKEGDLMTIKFTTYFLNEFKEVFDRYPKRAYNHYYKLSQSLLFVHDYKGFIRAYSKLWKIAPFSYKVIILPIESYAYKFYHKFK